jgi:hypothetical protein
MRELCAVGRCTHAGRCSLLRGRTCNVRMYPLPTPHSCARAALVSPRCAPVSTQVQEFLESKWESLAKRGLLDDVPRVVADFWVSKHSPPPSQNLIAHFPSSDRGVVPLPAATILFLSPMIQRPNERTHAILRATLAVVDAHATVVPSLAAHDCCRRSLSCCSRLLPSFPLLLLTTAAVVPSLAAHDCCRRSLSCCSRLLRRTRHTLAQLCVHSYLSAA